MSTVETEHVLVVPTQLFHDLGHFQGFSPQVDLYLGRLLENDVVSYRPRAEMEDDPSFKQLIPYAVFRYRSPDSDDQFFQYRRGAGQGEERLHAKRSIGVGGHISSSDALLGSGSAYREGLRRELAEEVVIGANYAEKCVGLINDDDTDVGRVHLGVVHLIDVEQPSVAPNEQDIQDAGFRPLDTLCDDLKSFETWSQIVIHAISKGNIA